MSEAKMAEIFTSHGERILIDDEDFDRVSCSTWSLDLAGYPRARIDTEDVRLHRFVIGANDGQHVDHKNGDLLDARKANLRICTHAENMRNRKVSVSNKCGLKGVSKDRNRWRALIYFNGRKFSLGTFDSPEAAHAKYREAAQKLHGEFARFA
ncbi:AP2 domain-containing protein [Burkholderia contaminans]|uniref:AP2 domain-containing protein n=1 Tax=Burkholderia contaminans TaxID=488447 RepID=UPI001C2E97D6|nr:AP2 domain-containing protein [Burkholderia contaminans]